MPIDTIVVLLNQEARECVSDWFLSNIIILAIVCTIEPSLFKEERY